MKIWHWLVGLIVVVGAALGIASQNKTAILSMVAHARLPHVEPNHPVTWAQGPSTVVEGVQPPNIVGKRASVAYQVEVTTQDSRKLPLFESLVLLQQDNGWRVVWPPQ